MPAALVLAFVLVPIAEIYLIIQAGQAIGAPLTLLVLVVDSLVGAWLLRQQGRRAWTTLQDTLAAGRVPGRELADGALVLVGGTLLLTPGFLTDAVGLVLLAPISRPVVRRLIIAVATRRVAGSTLPSPGHSSPGRRGRPPGSGPPGSAPPGSAPPGSAPPGEGRVIPGEVAHEDAAGSDGDPGSRDDRGTGRDDGAGTDDGARTDDGDEPRR